jgi:hypothetical protein
MTPVCAAHDQDVGHTGSARSPIEARSRVADMTQQPVLLCAICTRQVISKLADQANAAPAWSELPKINAVSDGRPLKLSDGSWQVPLAHTITNGEAVCTAHLVEPQWIGLNQS